MPTRNPPRPLCNPIQAAEYLGSKDRTLERWRHCGGGPPFVKVGRRVMYRLADLDAWLDQQTRKHTGASVDMA